MMCTMGLGLKSGGSLFTKRLMMKAWEGVHVYMQKLSYKAADI